MKPFRIENTVTVVSADKFSVREVDLWDYLFIDNYNWSYTILIIRFNSTLLYRRYVAYCYRPRDSDTTMKVSRFNELIDYQHFICMPYIIN